MNWLGPRILEFLIFFHIPLFVEAMAPEWTDVGICLVVTLAVDTFEKVRVLQTSFSLYLHNQWTDFHKLSCAGKPQMRAICTYVKCTKATTNDWDIRTSVAVKASSANISWTAGRICMIELALGSAHQSVYNDIWCVSKQKVLVEIQAYQYSDIISYLLKLAWQLLWQMTAPIRYEFWSCNGNSLYTDHYFFVYILLYLRIRPQT